MTFSFLRFKKEASIEKEKKITLEDIINNDSLDEGVKSLISAFEKNRAKYVEQYNEYHKNFIRNKKVKKDTLNFIEGLMRGYLEISSDSDLKNFENSVFDLLCQKNFNENEAKNLAKSVREFLEAKRDYEKSRLAAVNAFLREDLHLSSDVDSNKSETQKLKLEKSDIFRIFFLDEKERLIQASVENWPPKRKNVFKKALDWWLRQKPTTRLAISSTIVGTLSFGVAGITPAAALTIAGFRFARGLGGIFLSGITGKAVESILGKRLMKKIEREREELTQQFSQKLRESQTSGNSNLTWQAILKLSQGVDEMMEKINSQRKRDLLLKAGIMTGASFIGVTGSTPIFEMLQKAFSGSSALEIAVSGTAQNQSLSISKESVEQSVPTIKIEPQDVSVDQKSLGGSIIEETQKEILSPTIESIKTPETVYLQIGSRGPEGTIIDYFRNNPEIAKIFGCPDEIVKDGKIINQKAFNEWVGKKAHLLWLEHAKEALKNEELKEEMQRLGYSLDLKGYLEMMKRIGKGYIVIDPADKKIELVDMEYLKARDIQPENISKLQHIPSRMQSPQSQALEKLDTGEIYSQYGLEVNLDILPLQKWNLMDRLIFQAINNKGEVTYSHVETLLDYLKKNKITPEDFAKYYSFRGFYDKRVYQVIKFQLEVARKISLGFGIEDNDVKKFLEDALKNEEKFIKFFSEKEGLSYLIKRLLKSYLGELVSYVSSSRK